MPTFESHGSHHTWIIGRTKMRMPPMLIEDNPVLEIAVSEGIRVTIKIGDPVKISGYQKRLYVIAIDTIDDKITPYRITIAEPTEQ